VSALPTLPAIDRPTLPDGELRAPAGPSTIVLPLRARIAARSGARVVRCSLSPRPSPGNAMLGAQPKWPPLIRNRSSAFTVPKMRVATVIGTCTMPEPMSFGSPATIRWAVAVSRARV
jgi:hypothetical protein